MHLIGPSKTRRGGSSVNPQKGLVSPLSMEVNVDGLLLISTFLQLLLGHRSEMIRVR